MGMPEKLGSDSTYKATVFWWFAAVEDQSLSSLVGGVRAVCPGNHKQEVGGGKQQGKAAFS